MQQKLYFLLTYLFLLAFVQCQKNPKLKKNEMLGVDTVHNIKIDKDTIITRNMKLGKKIWAKNAQPKQNQLEEESPDWSYSSFPNEVQKHVHQFKQNMSECLKEVQQNDPRTVKRLSPGKESPVHGECLIACVLKRARVIENRDINKGNLLNLVGTFYSKETKVMKKLENNVDRCIEMSKHIKNECDLAAHLNSCTNDIMSGNKHKITLKY